MSGRDFKSLMRLLPVKWQTLLGQGMSWFISNQEPEKVEFVCAKNGYIIRVATDEENIEDAKQFWEQNVEPRLD